MQANAQNFVQIPGKLPKTPSIKPVYLPKNMKQRRKFWVWQVFNLSQKTGSCFATNAYFAKKFQITKRTVQNWLERLQRWGYIVIEFFQDTRGTERRIKVTEEGKKFIGKISGGGEKKGGNNNTNPKNSNLNEDRPFKSEKIADNQENLNWAMQRAKKWGFDLQHFKKCWYTYFKRGFRLKNGKKIWNIFKLYAKFWQHKEPRNPAKERQTTIFTPKPTQEEYQNALQKLKEIENYYCEWAEREIRESSELYRNWIVNTAKNRMQKSAAPYLDIVKRYENG